MREILRSNKTFIYQCVVLRDDHDFVCVWIVVDNNHNEMAFGLNGSENSQQMK